MLARRYARALIQLAPNPAQRDKALRDFDAYVDIATARTGEGGSALVVLSAERFPVSQRLGLSRALAAKVGADPILVKFLDHVIERGRGGGIPLIAAAYRRLADEAAGRVRAKLTSARPLAPDAVARLKSALEQATGKQVLVTTAVEPELIGGVVTEIGSFVLDGSVKAQLAGMRASFARGD
jgi:F-type H+-transporting ATPase subunit delta